MFVLAGHVGTAHGVKGEVLFKLALTSAAIFKKTGVLFLEDGTPFSIAQMRPSAKGLLIKFAHVADRTAAEKLRGLALFIRRADLPPTNEDEVYYADLLTFSVYGASGQPLGHVADVFYNGAQTILVVQLHTPSQVGGQANTSTQQQGGEALIPYTEDAVAATSTPQKRLDLTPFGEEFFGL